ncbi:hypothetical protein GCM10009555_013880 [Acrocarpospora macrocephala]|uniref:Uncharacterized protein n=1 Tax=Acrocarpospora macrocephala TaxID=150177 RepID=A0A5M3WHJ7_9ACTN|nr:hypothetical protein Amac_017910 [Acrocarpospora macrocephala]
MIQAVSHPDASSRNRPIRAPVVMAARRAPAKAMTATRTSMVFLMLPDITYEPVADAQVHWVCSAEHANSHLSSV